MLLAAGSHTYCCIQGSIYTRAIAGHVAEALITLNLERDKDPIGTSSFRPVSLINTYIKILTKVLATRLEGLSLCIIHTDQVGCVKGHSSSDSVRRL